MCIWCFGFNEKVNMSAMFWVHMFILEFFYTSCSFRLLQISFYRIMYLKLNSLILFATISFRKVKIVKLEELVPVADLWDAVSRNKNHAHHWNVHSVFQPSMGISKEIIWIKGEHWPYLSAHSLGLSFSILGEFYDWVTLLLSYVFSAILSVTMF